MYEAMLHGFTFRACWMPYGRGLVAGLFNLSVTLNVWEGDFYMINR